MADEDREEGSTPDPWEGIDAGSADGSAPDIAFPFDEGLAEPLLEPEQAAGDAAGADDGFPEDDLGDGSSPVLQWDASDDPAAGVPAAEVPLALFPPADDPEAGAIDHGIAGDGVITPATGESSISIQSSSIQIGTGRSGIVAIDEWADAAAESVVDSGVGTPEEPQATPAEWADLDERADGEAAEEFPFEDAAFDDASQGILSTGVDDAQPEGLDVAEAEPLQAAPDPFVAAFGDLSIEPAQAADAMEVEHNAVGAAAPAAAAAAKPARKAAAKTAKKKKQGGIGQMIGVVLGGVMALPITYAILVWGFQKDPFKLTKMVPPDVAFLLPQKFQPGFKRQATSVPIPAAGSSLDDLPTAPPPADVAATETEPEASNEGEPAVPSDKDGDAATADEVLADVARSSGGTPADAAIAPPTAASPAPPPAPEPLDLSGLDAAVKASDSAIESLLAVEDADDPVRRKLLVSWYKSLAKVGEELAMLETVAADTGHPLTQTPPSLAALQGRIAGSDRLVDDLGTLGRMWLSSQKRPADGVVLLGTFGSARKVGPYWYTRISMAEAEGSAVREVSVISRSEPTASEGDRVMAMGVLFSDDFVWAAECRRLEAAKSAAAEDLF